MGGTMSFFKTFFNSKQNNARNEQDKIFTIPPKLTATEISTVQLTLQDKKLWSVSCILLSKPIGEWQVSLALDCSYSMRGYYGKGLTQMPPVEILKEYQKLGDLEEIAMEGEKFLKIAPAAMEDLEKRGFSKRTENIIEPLSKKLSIYLLSNVCQNIAIDYYSCGEGNAVETVSTFTKDSYEKIKLDGPKQFTFGKHSKLVPFVKNFVSRHTEKNTICFIITDGMIDDWSELKSYSRTLLKEIISNKRKHLKFVLLIVGEEMPTALPVQIKELQDSYVLWDYKIIKDLRVLEEIFLGVNGEEQIIADTGIIYDDKNNVLREYNNGVPAKLAFSMSVESDSFSINIGEKIIQQKIPMMAYHLKD